jgi:hypothetical protein
VTQARPEPIAELRREPSAKSHAGEHDADDDEGALSWKLGKNLDRYAYAQRYPNCSPLASTRARHRFLDEHGERVM